MSYIGNSPANVGNYQVVDDISASFNGTTTSFALTASSQAITPAKSGQLLVSINGVLQEPDDTGTDGFKVSSSNIVFSSAPATGSTFWCVYQGQNVDIGTPSDGTVGTAQMSSAELALTGGLSLGDNVKAKFGAGDDLQIYHDGSNSYVADAGTGDLILRGSTGIKLQSGSGVLEYLSTNSSNGSVELKLSGATKLATTSTGIDVTGTVTADGLDLGTQNVGGDKTIQFNGAGGTEHRINFADGASSDVFSIHYDGTDSSPFNDLYIESAGNKLMKFDQNGDISFYEDTGTTPKFFWDASAESLGIGTSSPAGLLELKANNGTVADLSKSLIINNESYTAGTYAGVLFQTADTLNSFIAAERVASYAGILKFAVNAGANANDLQEAMRINSSGNVGIGTSSPTRTFHSKGASGISTVGKFEAGGAQVYIQLSSEGQAIGDSGYIGYSSSKNLTLFTDDTERLRINSSGNVGIGTAGRSASGYTILGVDNATNGGVIEVLQNGTIKGQLFYDGTQTRLRSNLSTDLVFDTNDTERMRIDSSGNVLVGKTAVDTNTAGFHMGQNGFFHATRDEGVVCQFNRQTSDGEIIRLRKDGTTVGSIGSHAGIYTYIGTDDTGLLFAGNIDAVMPYSPSAGHYRDNGIDLGVSSYRFDDIYATNGTIQTSDRNEKQDIEELSEAEQRVAVACKGLMRKFRWQDAVAEKGDDARIHFGIIAQDLQDAFTAEGLDAGRYAMFISSTWYEKKTPVDAVEAVEAVEATYDDEGNELTPAVEAVEAKDAYIRTDTEEEPTEGYTERTRLGVRYPELLAFIISAI